METREERKIQENNDRHVAHSVDVTRAYEFITAKSDWNVQNVSSQPLVHVTHEAGQFVVADIKHEPSQVRNHRFTSPMGWLR